MPDNRQTIIPWLADAILLQKEADVIVQAVGRVRPFTRSREIFTFHAGVLPGVRYTREFLSLDEARSHFGITTPCKTARQSRVHKVRALKAEGQTHNAIAKQLGISLSTVKRDLRIEGVIFPINIL
jgi:DNA-binding NarL/FixJ family response regulator